MEIHNYQLIPAITRPTCRTVMVKSHSLYKLLLTIHLTFVAKGTKATKAISQIRGWSEKFPTST